MQQQLNLPLDYSIREYSELMSQIHILQSKKKLMYLSASWHNKRMVRIMNIIERIDKRPYSPINEIRADRLRKLALTMVCRMELEHKWHFEFKDYIYRLL